MKQTIIFLLALVVVFASCKTEVDLNAPYKNTTIIFGLLDPDPNGDGISNVLDTQWIKINKTFLGEGDNNAYAAIRDSSEYKDEDFVRKVVERIQNGEVKAEYELISETMSNRSLNGIFYGPEQTVYYFVPIDNSPDGDEIIGLDQNSEYRISLEFTDGRVVTATTKVVNSGSLYVETPMPNTAIILANLTSTPGVYNYVSEATVKWKPLENVSIYDVRLRFHFTEKIYNSEEDAASGNSPVSTKEDSLDYFIGSKTEDDVNGTQSLKLTYDGRGFFSFLQNNLVANPLIRRVIGNYNQSASPARTECFEVVITMGNSDLRSYIDVNSPATGVVQERPIYSNVSNGIGLFASRSTRILKNLPLLPVSPVPPNPGTQEALILGAYTAGLRFCDPNPGASSNLRCP
jgi:hypothetical protein